MTIGNVLVRNHQVLAKACLGGGFAYGFLYTNQTGSSPIRDRVRSMSDGARTDADGRSPMPSRGVVVVSMKKAKNTVMLAMNAIQTIWGRENPPETTCS